VLLHLSCTVIYQDFRCSGASAAQLKNTTNNGLLGADLVAAYSARWCSLMCIGVHRIVWSSAADGWDFQLTGGMYVASSLSP